MPNQRFLTRVTSWFHPWPSCINTAIAERKTHERPKFLEPVERIFFLTKTLFFVENPEWPWVLLYMYNIVTYFRLHVFFRKVLDQFSLDSSLWWLMNDISPFCNRIILHYFSRKRANWSNKNAGGLEKRSQYIFLTSQQHLTLRSKTGKRWRNFILIVSCNKTAIPRPVSFFQLFSTAFSMSKSDKIIFSGKTRAWTQDSCNYMFLNHCCEVFFSDVQGSRGYS